MADITELSFYSDIKSILEEARAKVYSTANSAMVQAYWNIGRILSSVCGENDRAAYGKQVMKTLSEKLTEEFGKGFTTTNLKYMRQFYLAFPKSHALRDELNWTQYRMLLKIDKPEVRDFYIEECANYTSYRRRIAALY